MRYDHIAAMNRAKGSQAMGGKTYRQIARKAPTPAVGSWERLAGVTTARWETATGDALAQYQFDVHGHNWEGI